MSRYGNVTALAEAWVAEQEAEQEFKRTKGQRHACESRVALGRNKAVTVVVGDKFVTMVGKGGDKSPDYVLSNPPD